MKSKSSASIGTLSIFGRGSSEETFQTTSLMWLAGIMLLSVPMVTLIDVPIARWFANNPLDSEIITLLEFTRLLSHGGGIALVLVGILMMAPTCRWYVPRLVALAMGGGAVATLAKMFVLRPRPNALNLQSSAYDSAWLWAFDWDWDHIAAFDESTRAFPSGSIATAVALTVGLWVVIPRARYLVACLFAGAFLQRLYLGSHFLSDLIGGAAFGLLWSYACFHPRLLGKVFDEMEPDSSRRPSSLARPADQAELSATDGHDSQQTESSDANEPDNQTPAAA